jgi:hypothetical protein
MTVTNGRAKNLWQRLNGPAKVGLFFALLAIVSTIIGIFRDPTTPITAWSLGMGSLISGATWGLVSWALATAAMEVEEDVRQAEAEAEAKAKETERPPTSDEPA